MAVLEDLLRLNSDAANAELAELMEARTGLATSGSTISRAIGLLGWTRKKVPRRQRSRLPACPRSLCEVDRVARNRRSQRFVFIDEAGSTVAMTRQFARAPAG
jgi:hypothetical protein